MKSKLLLSVLLLATLFQTKAQDLKQIMKPRPADYEYLSAPDSLGVRHQLLMPNLTNKNTQAIQNLPYPIIFIHGLNSECNVWGDVYTNDHMSTNKIANFLINNGLTFGGKIDFCLNDDGDNAISNKNVWTSTNNNIPAADIALYTNYNTDITVADFYFLNFNIDNFGRLPNNTNFSDVLSNEAAIAKQGVALKIAIQMVLLKTGRDKVILMGHSMAGLASREYIQNPSNWQTDGQHHVAKLVTTGTPHGGYTGTNNQLVTGIDSQSEAYRDLRKSYSWTGYDGVYLYGGTENSSIIKNILLYPFYNVDVNCNGIDEDNSNIIGLNQRQWRTELDYSYIVGVCTNCSLLQGSIEGDGIVRSENANLSNFTTQLSTPKNEFIYTAAQTGNIGLHSELPQAIPVNMQGLDEPNEFNLAYGVDFGKYYTGFTTIQPAGGYTNDFDIYKFVSQGNGNLTFTITNSSTNNITVQIKNTIGQVQGQVYSIPNGNWNFSIPLSAGQFYLEITGIPTTTSYLYPYTFSMTYTLSNLDFINVNSLKLYPNPTTSKVFFDNTSYGFDAVSIYNYLGQEVATSRFTSFGANQEIDMSALVKGVYILKFKGNQERQSVKIIKQ
jgi:pimeloyl-ACP methyl ester carboxylesterase